MTALPHRQVAVVLILAALAQGATLVLLGDGEPIASLGYLPAWGQWPLMLVALGLGVAGEMAVVRLRHGEEVEERTLADPAVIVTVLLLPVGAALVVPVAASLIGSLVRRRGRTRTLLNAANVGASVSILLLTVHTLAGPGAGLGAVTTVTLIAGVLLVTVLKMTLLALLRAGSTSWWPMLRARLAVSALTGLGASGLGAILVSVAEAAPALLPFTALPAGALLLASRTAAQQSEERDQSTRLLAVSKLLASRREADELISSFLTLIRQAFHADVAIAIMESSGLGPAAYVDDRETGASERPATSLECQLLVQAARHGASILTDELPEGWVRAGLAPLDADGVDLGAVVVASRDQMLVLTARELTLLTPLVSALALALRSAMSMRQLVGETSKLKAVVDQSSDGILVLAGDGTVQLWSPALETLSGVAEGDAVGRPLSELLLTVATGGAPCDPFLAGRELLSPESPQAAVELTVLRADGEQKVVRCGHAGVFDESGLVRDVVIVHDVTRERQVERLKADFIATVSHELRTPVTPIKGYADLLRRRGDQMSDEKRAECLEIISDRASHLTRLVEDLLLASRISATEGSSPAQVEMGRDDLVGLVRRACGDFGVEGERIVVTLPPAPVDVACDRVRVIQVLSNLFGNALKYSTPGTPVDIHLAVEGERAVVRVIDRGRGIPVDQLERVFEKFHRVEDPMRMTTSGTGLGLYIARQLSTAMGGTLHCTSSLGVGSVFVFALPLVAPAGGEAPSPPGAASVPVPRPAGGGSRTRRTPPWAVLPPAPTR